MSFFTSIFKLIIPSRRTVNHWLDIYTEILAGRNLKPKTIEIKNYLIVVIRQQIGNKNIRDVTPPDIEKIIAIYVNQDKRPSAKSMFHLLRDVFRVAYAQGWNDKNPTDPIQCPRVTVKRTRIVFDEFQKLVDAADKNEKYRYVRDAMLTALVTGQRRSDVVIMRKSHIKRNYLHVEQQKTGSKIAIPVKLRCNKIDMTILDVVNTSTADLIVNKNGTAVSPDQITRGFAKIRDNVFDREHWTGTPTTFHEIRSLAERLYREQRVDTMTLLGHKSQQTTDKYNDNRGREYKKLRLNRATYL